jgi:hypothetical protein
LLTATEGRYVALVTTDKTLRHEQSMAGWTVAIVVIVSAANDITQLRPVMPRVAAALAVIHPGEVVEV